VSGNVAGASSARRPWPLVTERLYLRPCTRDDRGALYRLWTDPDVRRWLWDGVEIPPHRAAAELERALDDAREHGLGYWMVFRRNGAAEHRDVEPGAALPPHATADAIGFAGFRLVHGTRDVELVYALAPHAWGHGYATEAAHALLGYAFRGLGLAAVRGLADPPNTASASVLERLGMRLESRRAIEGLDTLVYVLTRDAYARTAGLPAMTLP
jgi:RimJ/RimL family protein N-acetyltransferase